MRAHEAVLYSALLFGCAHQPPPKEMSAQAHRREAAQLRAAANDQASYYDPTALTPPHGSYGREGPVLFPFAIYSPFNPTLNNIYRATELAQHAREHEQAAARLEAYEEDQCREFPAATRAACPVLGPVRIEDLVDGVRLHLPAQMPVDATVEHMRCHLAYARARGFAPSATCPIYLPRTEIRRAPNLDAVDLVSTDPAIAVRLQRLARGATD